LADREAGTRLTEAIERIRWRHWHGQVEQSFELLGETMTSLAVIVGKASPAASAALKVSRLPNDLKTYVCGQSDIIIDYATADFDGDHRKYGKMALALPDERATANAVDATRRTSDAQGSMRGNEPHLRARSYGTLEQDRAVSEKSADRPYRRAA
jgi:hypothetical protein